MPVKWNIFRISNYLHLAGLVFFLYLDTIALIYHSGSSEDSWLVFLCIIILIANSANNINLLERYYPEKIPGKNLVIFSKIIFALALAVLVFAGISLGYVLYEAYDTYITRKEMGLEYLNEFEDGGSALVLLFVTLTGIYNTIFQVVLRKSIRRNYYASLDNFLEPENSDLFAND